jgi:hypothetical protein
VQAYRDLRLGNAARQDASAHKMKQLFLREPLDPGLKSDADDIRQMLWHYRLSEGQSECFDL